MKILIADDDPVIRHMVETVLTATGHETLTADTGELAWEFLESPEPPRLAVLDWMMPGASGPEICSRLRARESGDYTYVILLTARSHRDDVVAGLEAGADDFVTKPFERQELLSRVRVGERVLGLETNLARKVHELQDALNHVHQLQGLLPICMMCKKIRDDKDTWHRLENYIQQRSEAVFTHSLCHDCLETHYRKRT